jgi:hypothetical protein
MRQSEWPREREGGLVIFRALSRETRKSNNVVHLDCFLISNGVHMNQDSTNQDSTKALPLYLEASQKPKLMPKYIGTMLVVSMSDKGVQVQLPASYSQVHDKFNVIDVRPWLQSDRSLDVSYPPVAPHLALNPIVQLLDRKPYGRRPRGIASFLDIPCSYGVVRKDQSTDWVRSHTFTEPYDVQVVKMFEKRFPRSERLPCNSVADYRAAMDQSALFQKTANLEEDDSDEELDLAAHEAVDQYYGALGA